jgi:sulfite reductase alpha subunit-like flavoprotein
MAKDVHRMLVSILAEGLGGTEEEAEVYLDQLKRRGRYVKDVWS